MLAQAAGFLLILALLVAGVVLTVDGLLGLVRRT